MARGAPGTERRRRLESSPYRCGSPSRYHLAVIALIYFLPLAVMFFAYSVIGFTLWRCAVPGYHAHGANSQYLRAKKKVGWGGWGRRDGWRVAGRGRAGPKAALLGSRPAEHRIQKIHKCWNCRPQGSRR